jgi:hypothetical protein
MRVLTNEEIVAGIKEHIAIIKTRPASPEREELIKWFEGYVTHFEELPNVQVK